ncbi:hypothetical protein [Legionella brunensis]|uniref:Uncharacterized protein n=1 Tax=Legionella brunensis TaxID=29422 RepID=A0A0W0SI99_9GAMM|nr:hypothetical protein [Legionella brunensis]KTC82987.1 hypothetical protein Lbru_1725 [Legionella brunensis]
MFNELIITVIDGLSKIDCLLTQNCIDEASQVLTNISASFNYLTKNHCLLDEPALQLRILTMLTEKLTATSTRFYLALTHKLINDFNIAVEQYDFVQANGLYKEIIFHLGFMKEEYSHATRDGKEQSPVFISFTKDYTSLLHHFEQSVQKYNETRKLAQACNNLSNAFNFGETQRLFGLNLIQRSPYTLFTHDFSIQSQPSSTASNLIL